MRQHPGMLLRRVISRTADICTAQQFRVERQPIRRKPRVFRRHGDFEEWQESSNATAGMLSDDTRLSLADLSLAGVRLSPSDSVTIVRELILQVIGGSVPGVPSAHVIRLQPNGFLTVEGPVASDRAVSRAAQLLDALLPPFDAAREFKVPGALRLVVARALGTLDIPPYLSLEQFAGALERFGDPDPPARIRQLVARWAVAADEAAAIAPELPVAQEERASREAVEVQESALVHQGATQLTVSDIRRARRATGLALQEIAVRTRIPVPLLRQLEWGYVRNWPTGLYGRTQLVRYARASGLDEQVVVSTLWPLLEASAESRHESDAPVEAVEVTTVTDVPAEVAIVDLPLNPHVGAPAEASPRRFGWKQAGVAASLGIAAMLALLVLPPLPDPPADGPVTEAADSGSPPDGTSRSADPSQPAAEAEGRSERSAAGSEPRESGQPAGLAPPTPDSTPATANRKAPAISDARRARGFTDVEAAWSSSLASVGSAMFYGDDGRDGGGPGLVQAGADGKNVLLRITRVVDDNSRNFHARPSPDGTRIAFDSDRDGERGVYVADADGSNVRRVTGEGFAAVPSWSPDGKALAVVRAEPDRPSVWNLWLVDLASGDMRRLTTHRSGRPWGGSWFPDARRLAYSHEDRLIVLDVVTGRQREYRSPRKGRPIRTPAVSPDGRRIMFQVQGDGAWLLDLADGSTRRVLADPTAEEYTWSPDGRRVAYYSRQSGHWGVWLMLSGQ